MNAGGRRGAGSGVGSCTSVSAVLTGSEHTGRHLLGDGWGGERTIFFFLNIFSLKCPPGGWINGVQGTGGELEQRVVHNQCPEAA